MTSVFKTCVAGTFFLNPAYSKGGGGLDFLQLAFSFHPELLVAFVGRIQTFAESYLTPRVINMDKMRHLQIVMVDSLNHLNPPPFAFCKELKLNRCSQR